MATLVTPSPGAIAAAFYAVRTARLDSARPILELFRAAALDLDDTEAILLPQTLGRLLGLLDADPKRRSALLDVLATFDLFEALPDVRRLINGDPAPEILLTAAKLASNPGVRAEDRNAVVAAIDGRPIDRRVRDILRVLIDPKARADGGLQVAAHAERWPGMEGAAIDRIAPLVGIDDVGAPPQQKWLVAANLHEAGVSLRRIPIEWNSEPMPGWLSPHMVVLTWEPARFARVIRSYPALSAAQLRVLPRAAFAHTQAIRLVADYYGADRVVVPPVSTSLDVVNPINPEVYHLGSFDSHEVAVLTGTRRADLYTTLRDVLPPAQKVDHGVYWSFSQVVALRTWQYFRAQPTGRRPSRGLLSSLVAFAGGTSPTSVGVTADGEVLRREGDAWVNMDSDQIYLEPVRSLDSVFQPFELGGLNGGRLTHDGVPALLGPTGHSKVHPVLLGGSPAVIGTRIPVRALAEYERDQGPGTASRAYGVDPAILSDVLPLGFRLIQA
ncbi:MAG TPA: hypothetical protein DEV93_01235 [Chloroflexi bacterium]|nr:hypothetical protein [Chloroflexota bacterium]